MAIRSRDRWFVGVVMAFRSFQASELTEPFAVPCRVSEEGGICRQPAQIEMLIVLPGVSDTTEHLEAVLGKIDRAVADEGLGDARRLQSIAIVDADICGRRHRGSLAHLEEKTGIRQ